MLTVRVALAPAVAVAVILALPAVAGARSASCRSPAAPVAGRFFAHTSLGGRTLGDRLRAAGYVDPGERWIAGEVLAWGWGRQATPAATVRAWMASPPHRRLLLDRDYRQVGVGVVPGAPVAHPAGPDATYAAELATRW